VNLKVALGHKIQTANDEKLTKMPWYNQLFWYSKVKQNNETLTTLLFDGCGGQNQSQYRSTIMKFHW